MIEDKIRARVENRTTYGQLGRNDVFRFHAAGPVCIRTNDGHVVISGPNGGKVLDEAISSEPVRPIVNVVISGDEE